MSISFWRKPRRMRQADRISVHYPIAFRSPGISSSMWRADSTTDCVQSAGRRFNARAPDQLSCVAVPSKVKNRCCWGPSKGSWRVYPRAVMILAPRHPERFGEVAQLLEQLKIRFWRRSSWNGDAITGGVLLVDSIGELASLYALGDLAFVGGSLVPRGGHNIIEPAQYGVPIIVGNHTENFRDIIGLFHSRDAVRVVSPAELPLVWMGLLSNEKERRALGLRAEETLMTQTGATQRTLDALETLLRPASDGATQRMSTSVADGPRVTRP